MDIDRNSPIKVLMFLVAEGNADVPSLALPDERFHSGGIPSEWELV
jgi:hypothetical protein